MKNKYELIKQNEVSEQKNYYAIIPANVRYDPNLKDKAKLLYSEITALCNEKGYCWATNEYFANLYGVSKTTISLLIKNLIEKGYINSQIIYKEYLYLLNQPSHLLYYFLQPVIDGKKLSVHFYVQMPQKYFLTFFLIRLVELYIF